MRLPGLLLLALPVMAQTPSLDYHVDSSWNSGLQASLKITNPGASPVKNWKLTFTYPYNITSIWDAKVTSHSGTTYTVTGASWDLDVPAAGSLSFGWVASSTTGATVKPTNCKLNNVAISCGGVVPPSDTTPPSVPTGLQSTGQTASSVTLAWGASTDNTGGSGLAGYEVLQNGTVVSTVPTPGYTASNLAASTTYTFGVRARDNAGNVSATTSISVATKAAPACTTLPGVPTGLTLLSHTSSSLTIAWTAPAAAPNCTLSYVVTQDGTAASTTSTTYTASGLQPSTTHSFTVVAKNQFGSSQAAGPLAGTTDASTPPPPSTWPKSVFAPYVDMLLWPTPVLSNISTASGVRYYTLAFVVARNTCEAAWGGVIPMSDNFALTDIANLRAQGGDVILSFGGANGVELAQSCTTVASLQAQYQAVIDQYSITRIDFDVEGGAVADPTSIDRRNKAIAGLQSAARSKGKTLIVQYTLPVLPTGLTYDGVNLLKNAVQNGVDIGILNIMAMDYGGPTVADPSKMGQAAVDAMNSTFAQMKTVYGTSKTDAQLRAMQGVTPMIGLNDVTPEVFTLSTDAGILLNAARSAQIGLLAMWSVGRDQMCPGNPYVASDCSGVTQSPWAFSTFFNPFTVF